MKKEKSPDWRSGQCKSYKNNSYFSTSLEVSPLPNRVDLEKNLIGAIIIDSSILNTIGGIISWEDLYREVHQKLWRGINRMIEKDATVDLLNLIYELKESEILSLEDEHYIFSLPIDAYLEFNHVEHAKQILECSVLRQTAKNGYRLYEAAARGDRKEVEVLMTKIAEFEFKKGVGKVISLSNHKPERLTWLLENAIPDRFPTILYGEGGMGKSFIALFICVLVCLGRQKFLELQFSEEPRNVLYMDYELDENEITRRALQIARGLGLSGVPNNLYYWSPEKSLDRVLESLRQIIKSKDIGFIVIDSLGASAIDGENVSDIVGLFTKVRKLGIPTLILDHQAKLQAKESYGLKTPYGSVYKYNLSRSVFQLSSLGREGNRISLSLNHTKSNFGKLLGELVFDILFEGDRVLFTESQAKTPKLREMELIRETINKFSEAGKKVNQQSLINHFKGIIGKDKVISLLEQGVGELWKKRQGTGREFLYSTEILKFEDINNTNFRISKSEDDNFNIPEVIDV